MSLDFFFFILFYFLILFSTIGFGLVFENIFKLKETPLSLGYVGLLGILFLTTYSYASHYLFPHGIIHNLIVLIIGLAAFVLLIRQKKSEFLYLLIIFFILLSGIFLFKTHDDFPYYHFPYAYHLTQNSVIFGTGILNHGFRTPSSIFFLNSLFYFPHVKYHLFQMGAILFFGFSVTILINDLKKNFKVNKTDNIFFLRLLCLVFSLVFFYRIQEHGTDRSAQILILLFIIEIFNFRKNYNLFNYNLSKILILLTLIVGLKLFYLLYLIFIIPIIYYLYEDKKINLISKLFYHKLFYLSVFSFILYILTYFINTGCLFYPISISCFENFSWSIQIDYVEKLKLHYENWAKAGSGAGYTNNNPENYVKGFNWVLNWIDKYFFNKVLDFVVGIIFVILIFFVTFCKFQKFKNLKINYKFYYLIILILFVEWFLNHPALRYGGYCIIALIFFIPFSSVIDNLKNVKNFEKKVIAIILISFVIFISRNVHRINKEMNIYNYNFLNQPYYFVDESHFRIQKKINSLISDYKKCELDYNFCNKEVGPIKIVAKFGKYIVTRNAQ